jgi:2'-5' RNA ligase/GNAT superfamily N-acetyltransferase
VPRRRLGVALLLPGSVACEIDGLRRALGDPGLGRVPAHVTLVSPVNVREADLGAAMQLLRTAAAATAPIQLQLGPPASFLPANAVLHLPVAAGADACSTLRGRLQAPPLQRPASWPYVPHATLAEELDAERIAAAVDVLDGAVLECEVDRVHLLERGPDDGVWRPIADARLAPAVVVGRGGLPLELGVTGLADPDASALLVTGDAAVPAWGEGEPPHPRVVVTARRDGEAVGVAWAGVAGGRAELQAVVVRDDVRREGVGGHLLAALESAARDAGAVSVVAADDLAGDVAAWLATRGWTPSDAPVREL